MLSTMIEIRKNSNSTYNVVVKQPFLIFFYKQKIYKDLSKTQVQNLTVPFGMFVASDEIDYDCFPTRI